MKRLLELIFAICLVLLLAGLPSGSARGASPGKPIGELRIGVPTLLTETFHPYRAPPARKFYLDMMYDYLVGTNEKMELDPNTGVAYKWEEAPDHMSWTYYIRDGVKFHDGTPLSLEDVKYSLETILDKNNTIGPPEWKPYLDRVEIVPPNKVVAHLKKPWLVMPYFASPASEGQCVILPKKYIEGRGVPYFENHPIGSGPYKFLEKKEGNYIKLVAQDSHWRVGIPKYRYVTLRLIPEEGTRSAALRAGEVDAIIVSIARSKKLEEDAFLIREKTGDADLFLIFNRTYQQDNPLSKKKVRQALIYAIDKASIVKRILYGRAKVIGHANYIFSTSIALQGHEQEFPLTPYDPKKAKQLLVEAGYPKGFTIYLYSFATGLPEQKLVNEVIAGYWQAIGMDVKILEMDYGAFRPIWRKHKEPAGPSANTFAWPSKLTGTWTPIFNSDIKANEFSQVQDKKLDQLIEEFHAQTTLEGYLEAERRCGKRTYEQYYNTGIASTGVIFATSEDVPKWEMGQDAYSYRFEYIGAAK